MLEVNDIFECYSAKYSDKINIENAFSSDSEASKFVYPPENSKIKRTSSVKTHEPYFVEEEKPDLLQILKESSLESLSKEAKIVYNNLNKQKFTVDDLIGLEVKDEDILSALTELEVDGFIKALPGGYYERLFKEK